MDFLSMVFIFIVGLIFTAIILYFWWKIAEEFYDIAVGKGHKDRKYFWYCFLLGFVGYLLVIALPDKTAKLVVDDAETQVIDELPEI